MLQNEVCCLLVQWDGAFLPGRVHRAWSGGQPLPQGLPGATWVTVLVHSRLMTACRHGWRGDLLDRQWAAPEWPPGRTSGSIQAAPEAAAPEAEGMPTPCHRPTDCALTPCPGVPCRPSWRPML